MGAVYDKYYNEVYNDARNVAAENFVYYLENNYDFNDAWDDLFMDDSVTGNASGSYWFNRKKAEESLGEFIWDEDIIWLLGEMGYMIEDVIKGGPEATDVIIRCAMLSSVCEDVRDYVCEMLN